MVFQWLGVVKELVKEEMKFVISLRVECNTCVSTIEKPWQ